MKTLHTYLDDIAMFELLLSEYLRICTYSLREMTPDLEHTNSQTWSVPVKYISMSKMAPSFIPTHLIF